MLIMLSNENQSVKHFVLYLGPEQWDTVMASSTEKVLHPSPANLSPPGHILQGWFLEGVFDASGLVQRLPINHMPFRIGRQSTADLHIASAEISRTHAEIFRRGNHLVIHDFGSTNGTFVNQERVALETRLHPGDRISFAHIACLLTHDLHSEDIPTTKLD